MITTIILKEDMIRQQQPGFLKAPDVNGTRQHVLIGTLKHYLCLQTIYGIPSSVLCVNTNGNLHPSTKLEDMISTLCYINVCMKMINHTTRLDIVENLPIEQIYRQEYENFNCIKFHFVFVKMDFKECSSLPPNPRANANPISKLFFLWILPLFRKGYTNELHEQDLYAVLKEDETERVGEKMQR